MGLSPEAGFPQTSIPEREAAVHVWSTSAAAGHPLHWWPPTPGKEMRRLILTRIWRNFIRCRFWHVKVVKKVEQKVSRKLDVKPTTEQKLFHFFPQQTISIATHCRAPGNNLPSSWHFFFFSLSFWFQGLGNSKGLAFPKTEKATCACALQKQADALLNALLQMVLTRSVGWMKCLWRKSATEIKVKVWTMP